MSALICIVAPMTTALDGLLWALRTEAHARSYRLGLDDAVFWRAYALVQHPAWSPSDEIDAASLGPDWEDIGRELSELHLGWRTTGGWPPAEPLPAEAHTWRVQGVPVLELAPSDPLLAARLARVAVQTVRRLAELPALPGHPTRGPEA